MDNPVTVSTNIHADIDTVWEAYNSPEHIENWYAASDSWHCPSSEGTFREAGRFTNTMASKDGSMQFDFEGTYTKIIDNELVAYKLDDDRNVEVHFTDEGSLIHITLQFDPESKNDITQQKLGWEAILNNFAEYAESL